VAAASRVIAFVWFCAVLPSLLLWHTTEVRGQATAAEDALAGIVFVGAPIFDEATDGGTGVYQGSYHWRDSYIYARSATYHKGERTMGPVRPGRNLFALVPARPDGKLTRLTHLTSGAVFKPEPHFDGKKVLFAMRRDGEDWFHLYEINVDGTALRQLTDGPFNDFAGVYLPDGRIVFCSDRTGYLEEYHEERTETLFTMNGDGSGIQQITFAPGTYFEPSVLRDGRILFSFWDAFHIDVPPFDKHETYLMTVRPDGTEERHFFGAGQYQFFNRERHSGVGLTQAREMPDGRILVQSEMGPSLLDLRAGLAVRDALAPIFPGTTSIQLGGTTHRSHLSPLGTRSTAYPLQDGRILYSATAPGARESAIYVCDPDTRAEKLVHKTPNYAEFDAVPVLVKRPLPANLPGRKVDKDVDTAKFLVIAAHVADNPERARAMKLARFFRVIEAEYTGVTTSSHTNLETRILGVVPVLPDGSAYFEAPADTPIFLDPLDAGGNRLLMNWNYTNTSVGVGLPYPATQMAYMVGRPGEVKSCYGCHATQTTAVPNVAALALKYGPVKVTRSSTNVQYRRNDPEGYRLQARVGEAAQYRAWLKSADPVLRARGCEMLMYIEDGSEADVPVIAALLGDKVVEVRRAAALALTRLVTKSEVAALKKACKDEDWQVRFAAAAALAVLGEFPPGAYDDPLFDVTELSVIGVGLDALKETWQDFEKRQLTWKDPPVTALRAAGKRKDAAAVPLLVPWLKKHEWEFHAAEAAVALGRIGTPQAVDALWQALRSEVPNKQVHISRYLQHGPRPEEYALLKGLVLARAKVAMPDVHLLIALLPNTFMEKPRFEDRLRGESQRVLLPRLMLEHAGLRQHAVALLIDVLRGKHAADDPLYQQMIKGINLERPFSEHGRPFPVVAKLGIEEGLWLLGCLLDPAVDLKTADKRQQLEDLLVPCLTSKNHRERIDAAVLLGRTGFGPRAAKVLMAEIARAYDFPEIASIGKGMPDDRFRDKAYFVYALAHHLANVNDLKPFADPLTRYRDIRYGLARGLAMRGKTDGLPLLAEMAVTDPISLVRQQARYAIAEIQDRLRLAGQAAATVAWPAPKPLEAWYPPRGLKWADTTFVDLPKLGPTPDINKPLKDQLAAASFRNLNMAQATGAQQMMIAKVEETRLAFAAIAKLPENARRKQLLAALELPYPYVRYLALKTLADVGDRATIPTLVAKLESFGAKGDALGYWWCCEALGKMQAKEALPVLARYATATNPPETFGPEGMPLGYVSARTLGRIVADVKHADVQRLLASDNVWLRAGALRGLAEASAAGVDDLLGGAAQADQPALVRQEATVHLHSQGRGK
jgi:HEAT repeat protein